MTSGSSNGSSCLQNAPSVSLAGVAAASPRLACELLAGAALPSTWRTLSKHGQGEPAGPGTRVMVTGERLLRGQKRPIKPKTARLCFEIHQACAHYYSLIVIAPLYGDDK